MKGDPGIIDILNGLLAGELTAVDQYLIHGEMYADFGFPHLADHSLHESDHERQHARALIQRILFLEGVPDLGKRHPLKIGGTVPEMLQADLDVEYHVVEIASQTQTFLEVHVSEAGQQVDSPAATATQVDQTIRLCPPQAKCRFDGQVTRHTK